ncbi:MAG: NADP(H)-dependent aldo-keto reductase [Rhodospirillales bacterium]|nr:NADP(H)-dependent aldo-keto reductase [Rhodospirillales bacterium]MDH3911171.1 NADP(H)-dependent aldo-keto reductase [Rhodospirillales bacterium]MDH3968294.1 NADP(H)-dependent aldo-keto reductase [Rhodospirillales bacterium]
MEYRRLGRTDLKVSVIGLGSMTWGEQVTEQGGFAQMDCALERGVNFIDTAEMYAVPPRAATYGRSEEIIGNWLTARGGRDKVLIATKVTGPSDRFPYMRDGKPRLDRRHITEAVEASLRRLGTDYIDLYQLHWPERPLDVFGELGYRHEAEDPEATPMEETLAVLGDLIAAGKLRSVGLSNETPWGVMRFLALAETGRGPRMVSVQNSYSLLNRTFEPRLAEVAIREDCGLLAYAPLGAGTLSGKYLNGRQPAGARLTLFPDNTRYRGARAEAAIAAYVALARENGLDPAQMALAYVASRAFLTSAIVGATSVVQLENNLEAKDLVLSESVLDGIEEIHRTHTYPCP